ncbi:hypothetical protein EV421DRAFT_1743754 [Armillaria borealis]|uniref:Uncharacterized protein n=1 Tax=Armillaria borealis TaxID=47425 RepID=A0AA39IX14_9AGAR|nr:hypothetical protein EV421DRAFT_1743754 [Armillaria borealis]
MYIMDGSCRTIKQVVRHWGCSVGKECLVGSIRFRNGRQYLWGLLEPDFVLADPAVECDIVVEPDQARVKRATGPGLRKSRPRVSLRDAINPLSLSPPSRPFYSTPSLLLGKLTGRPADATLKIATAAQSGSTEYLNSSENEYSYFIPHLDIVLGVVAPGLTDFSLGDRQRTHRRLVSFNPGNCEAVWEPTWSGNPSIPFPGPWTVTSREDSSTSRSILLIQLSQRRTSATAEEAQGPATFAYCALSAPLLLDKESFPQRHATVLRLSRRKPYLMQYGTGVVSVVIRPISIFDLALHLEMLDAENGFDYLEDRSLSYLGPALGLHEDRNIRPPKAKLRIDVPLFQCGAALARTSGVGCNLSSLPERLYTSPSYGVEMESYGSGGFSLFRLDDCKLLAGGVGFRLDGRPQSLLRPIWKICLFAYYLNTTTTGPTMAERVFMVTVNQHAHHQLTNHEWSGPWFRDIPSIITAHPAYRTYTHK